MLHTFQALAHKQASRNTSIVNGWISKGWVGEGDGLGTLNKHMGKRERDMR